MEEQQSTKIEQETFNQKKKEVKEEFKGFFTAFKDFIQNLLSIKEETDNELTITKIKSGIAVKGHTAWVLICSIFIASIGLNVSSTAVVIGAMLVSPLMGPILGLGLSIAINDMDTLKRSLINLGVMIGISLITSFLFFKIPLFQEATPEIIARTAPDVRDVLIALAGGFAVIIALSRRTEMTNTIAGIAIATALMPPLCTAGYGLATWNIDYFLGAMFLFIINTIFISLATFVVVKILRFPVVKYLKQAKRKQISRLVGFVATLIIGFSIYQFYLLFKANEFKQNAETFIAEMQDKTGAGIISTDVDYAKRIVKVVVLGSNINNSQKAIWSNKLGDYGLENTELIVQQDEKATFLEDEIDKIKNSYLKNQHLIATKDEMIIQKDAQLIAKDKELQAIYKKQIPFISISSEARIFFKDIEKLSYANKIVTDFDRIDTICVFEAKWNDTLTPSKETTLQLKTWLKQRLKNNDIELVIN